jgi:hypothetical protein
MAQPKDSTAKRSVEQTMAGHEIPVPKRKDFLRDLKRESRTADLKAVPK